jgi:hypothetical protein
MTPRPPFAAVIFYAVAGLVGLFGLGTIILGVLGAVFASGAGDALHVGAFMGGSLVMLGLVPLLYGILMVAFGLIAHDIHRIAWNTESLMRTQRMAMVDVSDRLGPSPTVEPVAFFYFERGVEHGPVSRAGLSGLIQSGRVNVFQRIETKIGDIRRPFEMRDLNG